MLQCSPYSRKLLTLCDFGPRVIDSYSTSKNLELFELLGTVAGKILCVGLLEEGSSFLDTRAFFEESSLAIDLFDLFRF